MDKDRLLNAFFDLVSIDSPSFGEREICDHITNCLARLGFELTVDSAGELLGGNSGNLYGYLEGDSAMEPLLFCTHMDTVEPCRGKKAILHNDGRITSAGGTVLGADDLAGIAAILEAIRHIQDQKLPHRPIEVLFTVAEEIYCMGAGVFDNSRLKSREAYILDLSGPVGTAARKAPSIIVFTVTVFGKAAHAGLDPEKGVHAIMAAAKAVSRIKMGHVDAETTCNIGVITGGSAYNIIPDKCTVQGEIRGFSHAKALNHMQAVKQVFEDSAESLGAKVEIETRCDIEAYEIPENHSVIKRFKAACGSLGLPVALVSTFGGSDNNHLVKSGITGLVAASAMSDCHSLTEYTTVDELERVTKLVIALMTGDG